MTGRLDGKVALITGAARGIGRAQAVRFAQEGADVIALDVCGPVDTVLIPPATPEDLAETARLVAAAGRRAFTEIVDVRDADGLHAAAGRGVERFGGLDIVCATAGITSRGVGTDMSEQVWQTMLDVNLTGVWRTCKVNEAYTPRTMQKLMSRTPLGDIMSPLQGSPLSRRLVEPTINEMFGPNTKPSPALMAKFHQILEYNDGKKVLHKVGRFLADRYTHRNRWVRAMRETTVPMRLIDGPIDPNSGAHMAKRYAEVIPNADVVMLADDIGHWPQIEAPEAVLRHFLEHVDRIS